VSTVRFVVRFNYEVCCAMCDVRTVLTFVLTPNCPWRVPFAFCDVCAAPNTDLVSKNVVFAAFLHPVLRCWRMSG
jgi:hypothetical protein